MEFGRLLFDITIYCNFSLFFFLFNFSQIFQYSIFIDPYEPVTLFNARNKDSRLSRQTEKGSEAINITKFGKILLKFGIVYKFFAIL